jgi:outer membrane protein
MSTRYLALGCLGLGLMVSPMFGTFATGAVPSNPKIGVININEVLQTSPAGKRASDAFEKTRKEKQAALDKQQDDLKKEDADLAKQAAVLKPDVLKQRQTDLQKKLVAFQQTAMKSEQELADARDKLLQGFLKSAEPKVVEIAKAEGVSVIFERRAVVWMDPAVDLTKALVAKLP